MIDLEELERLAKEATPGPWVANNWGRVWYTPNPDSKRLVCDTMRNTVRNPKKWRANARLIAAMREALPELIAENRALREKVRELEELSDRAIDEAGCLLGCMPTLDCRVCDYHDYCPKPMPGYEPDTETCRAAMRIFCDPKGVPISEKSAKEEGE